MKIKEGSRIQKLIKLSKEVALFIILVTLKLLERPKQEAVEIKESGKKKSGHLRQLVMALYRAVWASIVQNTKKMKDINFKEKRTRKTWARVKQDFKEWYASLMEEYEAKEAILLPEETIKQ